MTTTGVGRASHSLQTPQPGQWDSELSLRPALLPPTVCFPASSSPFAAPAQGLSHPPTPHPLGDTQKGRGESQGVTGDPTCDWTRPAGWGSISLQSSARQPSWTEARADVVWGDRRHAGTPAASRFLQACFILCSGRGLLSMSMPAHMPGVHLHILPTAVPQA